MGKNKRLRLSQPFQKAYADKYGHSFHVIEKEHFHVRPNRFKKRRVRYHMEKFQLQRLLNDYQRILYLDADVIPTDHAPDLLSVVPEGAWGCVREPRSANDWKFKEELERMAGRLGAIPADAWKLYFNTGVLVFDRSHEALWEWNPDDVFSGRWPEQTLLNHRILRSNTTVFELDERFNYIPQVGPDWEDSAKRLNAFFIHYAGEAAKTFIERDMSILQEKWNLPGQSCR